MSAGVGLLNVLIGAIYLAVGTMTIMELRGGRSRMGFSHFGAAWIAMTLTCGPHHLTHGTHVLLEGRNAGALDLVTALIALPAGLIWFLLRVEAFRGGRGDRHLPSTPVWLAAMPVLVGVYVGAIAAVAAQGPAPRLDRVLYVLPNAGLIVVYVTIGIYLVRTQLANQRQLRGWSVSGLALSAAFPTCALMHATYGFYVLTGRYAPDWHGLVFDTLAIPASLYFLWVVQALHRGSFRDWNAVKGATRTTPAAGASSSVASSVPKVAA
jgi:hypothetical protein